ncbi:MAG TPA: N-(5'-phosphoribosyl)anthranilate isomerase [Bacteroidales bacterium]|nr:N-(5'-phosphoribosyl)anthranilate isomerase [Bacteroidales bacterium]
MHNSFFKKDTMKIKICGNIQRQNISEVASLNPDYMGFIFFKNSKRDVYSTVAELDLLSIPSQIEKVAVFVNEKTSTVIDICKKHGFKAIQLHGDESPSICKKLKTDFKIIKAFRISNSLPQIIKDFQGCCDYFLFDTAGNNYGGNGKSFDHRIILDNPIGKPFFLSGGISVNDAKYLSAINHPFFHGVDINSKFETSPGLKDISILNQFFKTIKR